MKTNKIVGIAMAVGMLSIGALSASAANSDSNVANCNSKQSYQQFTQETSGLVSELNAKKVELKNLLYTDGIYDNRKANELESDVKNLKNEINAAAQKDGIHACYSI